MPAEKSSLSESVSATFMELSNTALTLNAISDEFGKAVAEIDESIKRLNLGIEVWTDVSHEHNDDTGMHWSLEIGYAKIGGKWGLSLRESEGNDPADLDIKIWSYNDAPRALRLKSIEKIPELLKQLSAESKETANALQAKLKNVLTVAETLKLLTPKRYPPGSPNRLQPKVPSPVVVTSDPKGEKQ